MASVDARRIRRYIYPDKYGVHKCATFGAFGELIKDVATLIGYTAIDEDA